ncbi:hypothetical protein [Nostoc sp.]
MRWSRSEPLSLRDAPRTVVSQVLMLWNLINSLEFDCAEVMTTAD